MSQSLSLRGAATALGAALAASLAVSVAPAYAVSSSSPAGHGATWLAGQLNQHGVIRNHAFDPPFSDYGLTADTVLGLKAIGGHQSKVNKARHALAEHVRGYTGKKGEVYAGSTAKLLVVAQQTGGGARSFGGVDLVKRLAGQVATDAPISGRIEDSSAFGDSANTVGQVFAVRGLLRAGNPAGDRALGFLLEQQCGNGSFRLSFTDDKSAPDQGCAPGDAADPDVTALAVIELTPLTKDQSALRSALRDAVAWLKHRQHENGSFGGSGPTSAANANSTGLAAWALMDSGKCGAARDAAHWLADLQVTGKFSGTKLAGERGAIAYDHAALEAGKKHGITEDLRDQWRRAGAQAAPALLALSRCGS